MEKDLVPMMRALAPDLTEEMARRALVLERIGALQPIGRRQLAAVLNLPEREIRSAATVLKDQGLIRLDASGMSLTERSLPLIEDVRLFSHMVSGLTELETRLSQLLKVDRVYVVAGDSDTEPHTFQEIGRVAGTHLRQALSAGTTLAVTGGTTVAQAAHQIPAGTPMNVMVVPARGGLGRSVETQANTLAEEIAQRLGGHHRLLHVPDRLDAAAMQELLKVPEVQEAVELLQRADVVLHGIGVASVAAKERRLSAGVQRTLREKGAVAEALGSYFSVDGQCLYTASSVGLDLARLKPGCRMIALAGGVKKAEAILAVMRHYHHYMLVTDEAAAQAILQLAEGC